ncbi:hypothetical protein [uncultured Bradyrhizobium sp.]|uniref:hypothetical protein n=1 Tax=uncultured Bradyrhizobium sp. TaxID=199684 RepID=UPI0035CC3E59
MDLDLAPHPKLIGAIAVLLEQDSTPDSSIILGRIAFSKEIDKQLNALISKRIQTGDTSPLTDQEINAVKSAVKSKVKDAIKSDQSFFGLLTRDQDDIIGFVYKVFAHPPDPPQPDISFQYFDFPEITSGSDNRFVLSGRLSLGPVPTPPVDRCATQRAALKAKTDQIHALETRITSLQTQLQHASPSQKAFIVQEITATGDLLTQAEAELPALQAALDACESRPHPGGVITGTTVGVGRDNR